LLFLYFKDMNSLLYLLLVVCSLAALYFIKKKSRQKREGKSQITAWDFAIGPIGVVYFSSLRAFLETSSILPDSLSQHYLVIGLLLILFIYLVKTAFGKLFAKAANVSASAKR